MDDQSRWLFIYAGGDMEWVDYWRFTFQKSN